MNSTKEDACILQTDHIMQCGTASLIALDRLPNQKLSPIVTLQVHSMLDNSVKKQICGSQERKKCLKCNSEIMLKMK